MDEIDDKELVENLVDGVCFVDINRNITFWNKAAERISGYAPNDVVGFSCVHDVLDHVDSEGRRLCEVNCPLLATMKDGALREISAYLHHKKGHRVPVTIRTTPIRNSYGKITGCVETFVESYSQSQVLQELWLANDVGFTDALTLLGNRRFCEMTLSTRIYELNSFNLGFGVIYIDLDYFNHINESFGEAVGDEILIRVGKTLAGVLRKLDFVTRWERDEFVVIIPGMTNELLKKVSERLRILIKNSYIVYEDNKISASASVGATIARSGDTPDSIIRRAQKLVDASKLAGCDRVSIE